MKNIATIATNTFATSKTIATKLLLIAGGLLVIEAAHLAVLTKLSNGFYLDLGPVRIVTGNASTTLAANPSK